MNDNEMISLAEQYLKQKNIEYVVPGQIGIRESTRSEVIFLHPLALQPEVAVIDPPDHRVWVDHGTGEIEWIYQM